MKETGRRARWIGLLLVFGLIAAACGGEDGGELSEEDAYKKLQEIVDDLEWESQPPSGTANVPPAVGELADTLPPIDEFPLVVDGGGAEHVVEVFSSTEKAGEDEDGWLVEVTQDFNSSNPTLSDGSTVGVDLRAIPSGLGYQFIAAQEHLPDAFTPSNQLWIEMAATQGTAMTPVSEQLAPNVAGLVMRKDSAQEVQEKYGQLDASTLIEAVIAGDIVMGYTDPFASSTGLNFLIAVLSDFAGGDESKMLQPDVVSAFEGFQQNVPYVALTTLQLREAVENQNGSLDAFVMEYQTFIGTDSLGDDYEFIPFGVPHDNPLYAVGDSSPETTEALELFAGFAGQPNPQQKAADYGFAPPDYPDSLAVPSGETLIAAQGVWKEKKDGGKPVVAVFVADTSGSMEGSRINALEQAMLSGADFITPDNSVGLVMFNDEVSQVLPIEPFDLNQKGRFVAAAEEMSAGGGTAMYDGIALGLQMLADELAVNPDTKPMLFVLSDGETTDGMTFDDMRWVIEGIGIPVYTVGFEANVDELAKLSALVEAASLDASEDDIEYKIGSMFNAEL